MFIFIIEVVVISILVSSFATWITLVPRYPKMKYAILQQMINAGLMIVLLTLFTSFEIYPSWLPLFGIILFVLWLSVRITNNIVRKERELVMDPHDEEKEGTV